MNFADSYIERTLELPSGTLLAWEKGGAPPEGKALLQILRCFPWVAEVADGNFSDETAKKVVLREAMRASMPLTGDPLQDAADLLAQLIAENQEDSPGPRRLVTTALAELALERITAMRAQLGGKLPSTTLAP